jgi:hypothetical protein
MKARKTRWFLLVVAAGLPGTGASLSAEPFGTAFTYQGWLTQSGVPLNGNADFQFSLWDAAGSGSPPTGGNQIGVMLAFDGAGGHPPPVTISNGRFTVQLDFGAPAFASDARWLQIAVRHPAASGSYATLSPRQKITPTPFALQTRGIVVDESGRAAIGSNDPSTPNNRLFVQATASIDTAAFKSDRGPNFSHVHYGPKGDWYIRSAANDGVVHLQDSGGRVAVGAVNPAAKLHAYTDVPGEVGLEGKALGSYGVVGDSFDQVGVYGVSGGADGIGVLGVNFGFLLSPAGRGVVGQSTDNTGVEGDSDTGIGVYGKSTSSTGVEGDSTSGIGVYGKSNSSTAVQADSNTGWGVFGRSQRSIGVFGQCLATDSGVLGRTEGEGGQAVFGYASHSAVGVLAISEGGDGVEAVTNAPNKSGIWAHVANPASYAGVFTHFGGGVALLAQGRAQVSCLEILGGCDLAEPFDVRGDQAEPGMVVIIDPDHPGRLKVADQPYDARVAGVVSGAGGINVGMVLSRPGEVTEGSHKVALTGRVFVLADAAYGPIEPGNLLTTSATPGHAMKASDREKAFGAVIGKAMQPLKQGRGLILVLVNLQ